MSLGLRLRLPCKIIAQKPSRSQSAKVQLPPPWYLEVRTVSSSLNQTLLMTIKMTKKGCLMKTTKLNLKNRGNGSLTRKNNEQSTSTIQRRLYFAKCSLYVIELLVMALYI